MPTFDEFLEWLQHERLHGKLETEAQKVHGVVAEISPEIVAKQTQSTVGLVREKARALVTTECMARRQEFAAIDSAISELKRLADRQQSPVQAKPNNRINPSVSIEAMRSRARKLLRETTKPEVERNATPTHNDLDPEAIHEALNQIHKSKVALSEGCIPCQAIEKKLANISEALETLRELMAHIEWSMLVEKSALKLKNPNREKGPGQLTDFCILARSRLDDRETLESVMRLEALVPHIDPFYPAYRSWLLDLWQRSLGAVPDNVLGSEDEIHPVDGFLQTFARVGHRPSSQWIDWFRRHAPTRASGDAAASAARISTCVTLYRWAAKDMDWLDLAGEMVKLIFRHELPQDALRLDDEPLIKELLQARTFTIPELTDIYKIRSTKDKKPTGSSSRWVKVLQRAGISARTLQVFAEKSVMVRKDWPNHWPLALASKLANFAGLHEKTRFEPYSRDKMEIRQGISSRINHLSARIHRKSNVIIDLHIRFNRVFIEGEATEKFCSKPKNDGGECWLFGKSLHDCLIELTRSTPQSVRDLMEMMFCQPLRPDQDKAHWTPWLIWQALRQLKISDHHFHEALWKPIFRSEVAAPYFTAVEGFR